MRRIVFVILASCLFALLGAAINPAKAGDLNGYRPYAWYPGGCCAGVVVPYPPAVRYLRYVEQLPYCAYCDAPPPRYVANPYWPPACAFDGCYGYDGGRYAVPVGVCTSRRVRVFDRRGRWVWRVKTVCD